MPAVQTFLLFKNKVPYLTVFQLLYWQCPECRVWREAGINDVCVHWGSRAYTPKSDRVRLEYRSVAFKGTTRVKIGYYEGKGRFEEAWRSHGRTDQNSTFPQPADSSS